MRTVWLFHLDKIIVTFRITKDENDCEIGNGPFSDGKFCGV